MTFADFIKLMQIEIDKNPGLLYTKCEILLLVDGSYVELNSLKIDEDKDLILSNEMEILK